MFFENISKIENSLLGLKSEPKGKEKQEQE